MGLGSENKSQRLRFNRFVKGHDWKKRINEPNDARRIVTLVKQDPIQFDSYAERKIKDLELYIAFAVPNETLKDFQKRMK